MPDPMPGPPPAPDARAGSAPGTVAEPERLQTRDVSFAGAGGDAIDGYQALPAAAGPHPGLLVLHEAFGLNDHIRDVARRFAAVGFAALAPDLYSREGAPGAQLEAVMRTMLAMPDERIVGDLDGAAAFLRSQPECSGRVGCIGFCSGGRQALLFACSSEAADAAVDCWGGSITRADANNETTPQRPVPVIDLLGQLSCPLMAVFGAEDANPSPQVAAALRERAAELAVEVEVEVYEDAGHAFFADYRPTYRPEAARRLWTAVVPFLHRHLDRPAPAGAA